MVDDDIVAGSEVAGAMLSLFEGFIYVCPSVSMCVYALVSAVPTQARRGSHTS